MLPSVILPLSAHLFNMPTNHLIHIQVYLSIAAMGIVLMQNTKKCIKLKVKKEMQTQLLLLLHYYYNKICCGHAVTHERHFFIPSASSGKSVSCSCRWNDDVHREDEIKCDDCECNGLTCLQFPAGGRAASSTQKIGH